MDEFEKIRAFSEEMSRKTEQAVANEQAEIDGTQQSSSSSEDNPNFLEEWTSQSDTQHVSGKSLSKTFWLVLSLTLLVLVGLIVVFWLLLKTPMEKGEIVSIPPTPNPVKVKPENPGGMVIPDQDKEIYSRLTKNTAPVKVARLFDEEEEQPVLPPVVVPDEEPTIPEVLPDVIEEVVVEEPVPVVQEEKPIVSVVQPVVPKETTAPKVKKDKATQSAKKKKTEKKAAETWQVQLFSSSDKKKVESTWKDILTKHKSLLSNMPMTIEQAEISGKGTFYRLKVGQFPSKTRASNLCTKLKKQKQDCIAVK